MLTDELFGLFYSGSKLFRHRTAVQQHVHQSLNTLGKINTSTCLLYHRLVTSSVMVQRA
jgi:hypothetical protein